MTDKCTCPSGDGSLRWPCPVHPSEQAIFESVFFDLFDHTDEDIDELFLKYPDGNYKNGVTCAHYRTWQAARRTSSRGEAVAGWKLVPIEPSWDMRNEGREFLIDGLEKEPEKLAYFLWKTMVAASPKELEKRDAAIDNAQATEGK